MKTFSLHCRCRIRAKQKQLNLGVGTERMIFHIDSTMKHSYSNDDTCFSIDVIDKILEEDFNALLDEGSEILHSIKGTILEEKLFIKTSLEEPPIDLELKPLPDNLEYVFLEEPSFLPPLGNPIYCVPKKGGIRVVTNEKDELVPTRPVTESVKVFMDDFSVFVSSFDHCPNNLDKMLQRCKDAHLVLNWEKCHFMVKEGIVLRYTVSEAGLKVDKAKINVISKIPPTTNIKGIIYPITDSLWVSPIHCVAKKGGITVVTNERNKLVPTCAPVIVSPNWSLPFELMYDARNFAVGAILGQKEGGNFHSIDFACKTLNAAQQNYTIT
ncbi:reverse transcriptase domain-containing protein [Tanacetum coccineum]